MYKRIQLAEYIYIYNCELKKTRIGHQRKTNKRERDSGSQFPREGSNVGRKKGEQNRRDISFLLYASLCVCVFLSLSLSPSFRADDNEKEPHDGRREKYIIRYNSKEEK